MRTGTSASVAICWGVSALGVSSQGVSAGGCLPGMYAQGCLPGGCLPRGVWPGGCLARGVSAQEGVSGRQPHSPLVRITDAYENITLPQLLCGR